MGLKNYSTTVAIEKTMMEIEKLLSRFGATHIYKMYNDTVPIALAFKLFVNEKELAFKLPMEEDKIMLVFKNEANKGKIPKRLWNDRDQARRTGWRIIKDWVASQLALFEIHLVQPEEIFLPYMYNERLGKTLYEMLAEQDFALALEYKE